MEERKFPPVSLTHITANNYIDIVCLCVSPEQEKYVGATAEGMVEAMFHPNYRMLGVFDVCAQRVVGFILYEVMSDTRHPYNSMRLHRFLIDCKYQKRGFGEAALEKLLDVARKYICNSVELRTHNENADAIRLYEKVGFVMSAVGMDKLHGVRKI